MPLFALIAVTLCAFAANSLLNRAGVDVFGLDPLAFASVRLASGAVVLAALVLRRGGWPAVGSAGIAGAAWLLLYLLPFSLAYASLPAGQGALILFGVVQITMFAGSALDGKTPDARQWLGMALAMAGLGWLLWPAAGLALDGSLNGALNGAGAAFMVLSGLGWGLFSLKGRKSLDPLGDMALSFVLLLPVAGLLALVGSGWSLAGVAVAVLSGSVMSGLGYALWYRVLPQIAATTGAVAQLCVPVIALVAGTALLGEALTAQVVLAAMIVLGGIAVTVLGRG